MLNQAWLVSILGIIVDVGIMSGGLSKTSSIRQRPRDSNSSVEPSDNNAISSNETPLDLEKAETAQSTTRTTASGQRVTRLRSLARRSSAYRFSHPLSHTRTNEDAIVDFDGPDDTYRPLNWPFRKKVITTLLYGLTTMGSTWASSVSVALPNNSFEAHPLMLSF